MLAVTSRGCATAVCKGYIGGEAGNTPFDIVVYEGGRNVRRVIGIVIGKKMCSSSVAFILFLTGAQGLRTAKVRKGSKNYGQILVVSDQLDPRKSV